MLRRIRSVVLAGTLALVLASPASADEGMWTLDSPPRKQLKEKYDFEPSREWLDHVRLSSARLGDGGSGSFVSPNGLLLTNHHVARGQIQKLSTSERNLINDGFYARTRADELKCPDLEVNVLVGMEEVTQRVLDAVQGITDPKKAMDARKAAFATITKESLERTGLRSDIVTLYNGGEYWLYTYKKYTDVRLVMAPETQIAFFGGDPDNFTFPRYNLDMTFLRVYENDQPLRMNNFFVWKTSGVTDGELVFVSGHPGSTSRLQTVAQLEYARDFTYPVRIRSTESGLATLREYAAKGEEERRRALASQYRLENGQKVLRGEYAGLLDPVLMEQKRKEEDDLRARVNADPVLKRTYGWAWDSVRAALEREKTMFKRSANRTLSGTMYGHAVTLVGSVEELRKPNTERLSAYQDASLPGTKFRLFSPAPLYPDMEQAMMVTVVKQAVEQLGPTDPWVAAVLQGKSPEAAVEAAYEGSRMDDPQYRRELFEGGEAAIKASTDPLIKLAMRIKPINDDYRIWHEKYVTSTLSSAAEAIGKARLAVYGKGVNPDATSSLRLSYGTVKGFPMNGTISPYQTTLYGLYDRFWSFSGAPPFHLPPRYVEGGTKLDLSRPFNYVSTCDIIGGNSGSPVINKNAEFVGLIFDGNIESLTGRFLYSDERARAVSVHPAAIIETLRKLYGASALADELEGKR